MGISPFSRSLVDSDKCRRYLRAALLFFIATLPWLAKPFFQLPALAFDNFTDAVFYPSYATNFSELVLRHGFIYYAMRFGVIFPDAIAALLFGVPEGWLLLRATLQSFVLVLIFLFFEKRVGWIAGAFGALLWWTSPVTLRILCTTYLDSIAVPFFVAGAILLAWPGYRPFIALAAGAFWGLAASSHLYLLILIPLMIPFVAGNRWDEKKSAVVSLMWALLGASLVWGIAYTYYRATWGVLDIWAPTKEFLSRMAAGDSEMWRSPLLEILSTIPAWLAPVFILGACAFLLRRETFSLFGAFLSLGATIAFFWLGDLVAGGYALSMPMYFSFIYPAFFLATATGFSEVINQTVAVPRFSSNHKLISNILFLLAGLFLIGSNAALARITTYSTAWIVIAFTAISIGVGFFFFTIRQGISWKASCFLTALIVSHALVLATPFYSQFLAQYKRIHLHELWQPALAGQLSRMLPPAFLDGRPLRFWFDDSHPGLIRLVQSSQLHSFSRMENGVASFPDAAQQVGEILGQSGVEIVVVLDELKSRTESATNSILSRLSKWSQTKSGRLQSKGRNIYYSILERRFAEDESPEATIRFNWEANSPSQLVRLADGSILLKSASEKWRFDASAALPSEPLQSVSVESHVLKGRFSLSVVTSEDVTMASTELWPTLNPVKRTLFFKGDSINSRLVLRNMMPNGSESQILLFPKKKHN